MNLHPKFCLLVLLMTANVICIKISVKNNGYEGVVVAFSPNTTEERGLPLIDRIKELFINASKSLYTATHRRLFFRKITILVPESWKKRSDYLPASSERFNLADVRIDEANPGVGDCPYTLQHMGCGHPGLYVHLTHNYLRNLKTLSTRLYGDPGKTMVHEWAHYRYGVFDEYGYPGHELFPMFYVDPNSKILEPNYCADQKLVGRYWNVNDDEPCYYGGTGIPDDKCIFIPYVDRPRQIKTSLSSYFYIENVELFCNETNHNRYAPNRHNILCDGKSAWQVIQEHTDLATEPTTLDPSLVTFKIVQPKKTTIILVLDISGSMNDSFNKKTKYTKMQMLRDNLNTWINNEVQIGWSIGIVSFELNVTVNLLPTTIINDSVRKLITERIPTHAEGGTCIACGLEKALKILNDHQNGMGGTIILVSDGEESVDLANILVKDIMEPLIQSRVRVISIIFTQEASPSLEKVANVTNGQTYLVSYKTGMEMMASALFETSAQLATTNTTVKVSEKQFNNAKNILNGSFVIDWTIGNIVTVSFSYQKKKDIANIVITKSNGLFMASLCSNCNGNRTVVKHGSNSYHFIFKYLEPGRYNYSVQTGGKKNHVINVAISSSNAKPITATCWVEFEKNEQRLIIFASINQGTSRVINAMVLAQIERPDESKSFLQLLDNGCGADVTVDDGIYSKYFTSFINDTVRRYMVKAIVTGNNSTKIKKSIFIGSKAIPKYQTTETSDVPTGVFERVSNGGSFQAPKQFASLGSLPPVKITDLRLINVSEDCVVFLQWTAPGSDLDEGKVSKYDIRYASNFQNVSTESNTSELNSKHIIPLRAGEIQIFSGKIPELFSTNVVYLALKSVDDLNNWSKLSNVISITSPVILTINTGDIPKVNKPKLSSKVRDLQVIKTDENGTVHVQWTAPKKSVYMYDIKYSDDIYAITYQFSGKRIDSNGMLIVKRNKLQKFVFTLNEVTTTSNLYVALRACDRYFNWSPTSNVIVLRKQISPPFNIPTSGKILIIVIIAILLVFVVVNNIVWYLKFK